MSKNTSQKAGMPVGCAICRMVMPGLFGIDDDRRQAHMLVGGIGTGNTIR